MVNYRHTAHLTGRERPSTELIFAERKWKYYDGDSLMCQHKGGTRETNRKEHLARVALNQQNVEVGFGLREE